MLLLYILILCISTWTIESYKILCVFPMPSHSHYVVASKLLRELAARGHNLTVISPFPQKVPTKNFRDIEVDNVRDAIWALKSDLYAIVEQSVFAELNWEISLGHVLVDGTLKNQEVQKLLHSDEKFDLIILAQFLNEGLMALASRFQAPIVLLSSTQMYSWGYFALKYPAPPSYVPNNLSEFTSRMTFWQRFRNTLYDLYGMVCYHLVVLPDYRASARKYIPGEPELCDYLDNASIILSNTHPSVSDVIPRLPNVIEIGGFHVEAPKELEGELKQFLDNATEGVVFFSMGSNLKSKEFPLDKLEVILKTFARISQKVLWKWENEPLPDLPANVRQMKWLPQQDILAHPNVKIFITQGGILSLTESVYHAVPLIGLPVFADQYMNLAVAAQKGYGIRIPFKELSEDKLHWSIDEILKDSRYKQNAVKYSGMLRDQPVKPLENAIFWTEFVAKHKGAPHLRYGGLDLNWAQRYLFDVISVIVLLVIGIIVSLYLIFKMIISVVKKNRAVKEKKQ